MNKELNGREINMWKIKKYKPEYKNVETKEEQATRVREWWNQYKFLRSKYPKEIYIDFLGKLYNKELTSIMNGVLNVAKHIKNSRWINVRKWENIFANILHNIQATRRCVLFDVYNVEDVDLDEC